ncbi:glycine-rich protein [Bdellovibrio sp. ArHS]|uniref:glycine-rich protein n=1 Tax=Bdellovibrio sp. ArHS TaxID=1569284 RepID=UPI0025C54FAC|nr:glycine-rich protein [Bdellovibrio sp. ArHS]
MQRSGGSSFLKGCLIAILAIGLWGCGQMSADFISTLPAFKVALEQTTPEVVIGDRISLHPEGGKGHYVYTILSGEGSIDPQTGEFTAPTNPGTTLIQISDSSGQAIVIEIVVKPPLQITSGSVVIAANNNHTFTATGGIGHPKFTVLSGGGSIDPTTGLYSPQGYTGISTIAVTDAAGTTVLQDITVNSPLKISPMSETMWTLAHTQFQGVDGVPPYSYSMLIGDGTLGVVTGAYQAPASATITMILVTDALGNTAEATVQVQQGVMINPLLATIAVGNQFTLSASGGPAPYVFSISSGSGVLSSAADQTTVTATGVGTLLVQVADAAGNTSEAQLTVNPSLQITPASTSLAVGNSRTFSGVGGVASYSYNAILGSIDNHGNYEAPATSGTDTVTVTDALGNTAMAIVTVNPALSLSPASKTLVTQTSFQFSASGGVPPYTYSSDQGTVASDGTLTAGSSIGSGHVTVTDALGNTSSSSVSLVAPLSLNADRNLIATTNSLTVTASGGLAPYVYAIQSGAGTVNSSTGLYTPSSAGVVVIKVTDALLNVATTSVTVNAALAISPSSSSVNINTTKSFSATGGVAPYIYSLISGAGSMASVTGLYTAPAVTGAAVVNVTDVLGNTSEANLSIVDCVPGKVVFNYTGAVQTFTQPTGCTKVTIKAWGAGGTGGGDMYGMSLGGNAGGGGYATGELNVYSGQTLYVFVGGSAAPGGSAWNGGGFGGVYDLSGGGYGGSGGGASDIRLGDQTLLSRVLVAGGGGGGSVGSENAVGGDNGGPGGGTTGVSGRGMEAFVNVAKGGSQSSGGAGASSADFGTSPSGAFAQGANGAMGDTGIAGGGGGYYGGGGGSIGSGGGGGSSYIAGVQNGSTLPGSGRNPGNMADADRGTAGVGGFRGTAGIPGRVVIYYDF